MNKCVLYGVVAGSVTAYAITDLHHPHLHIEQTGDTAPVQEARTVVVSTATESGPRTLYKELTVEAGSRASVQAIRST